MDSELEAELRYWLVHKLFQVLTCEALKFNSSRD